MGIAKVAESMQLCAYNLTINYYMVKLTNHKKTIDRPLGCKRWGIIAIIIYYFLQVAYLFYCTLTFRMMLIILSVTVCYVCLIMFLKRESTFITAI